MKITSRLIPQFRHAAPLSQLSPEEEADLVQRAQAGDVKAKEQLCAGVFGLLIQIARKRRICGIDWQEVVSDAYARLLSRLDRIDVARYRFCVYASLAIHGLITDAKRRAIIHAKAIQIYRERSCRLSHEEATCNLLNRDEVIDLLRDQLSSRDWMIISCRYGVRCEALSLCDIALKLGITPRCAQKHIYRVFAKARKLIESTGEV